MVEDRDSNQDGISVGMARFKEALAARGRTRGTPGTGKGFDVLRWEKADEGLQDPERTWYCEQRRHSRSSQADDF